MSSAWAIEAAGIGKAYGPAVALRRLDLQIAWGERIVLLGANGAGKTTLLRLIARLIRPTVGRIRIGGCDSAGGIAHRRLIGYLGHHSALYPDLLAAENLTFYARLHGIPDPARRVDDLLAQVGLADRRGVRVRALSRGQQQRLALARALLHDPPILVLDEPDTGLDTAGLDLLAGLLATPGRTVLLSTHHPTWADDVATRVLTLADGRIASDERRDDPIPGADVGGFNRPGEGSPWRGRPGDGGATGTGEESPLGAQASLPAPSRGVREPTGMPVSDNAQTSLRATAASSAVALAHDTDEAGGSSATSTIYPLGPQASSPAVATLSGVDDEAGAMSMGQAGMPALPAGINPPIRASESAVSGRGQGAGETPALQDVPSLPTPHTRHPIPLAGGLVPFLAQVRVLLWKDLLLEFRRRELIGTMLIFALLVIVVFTFALDLAAEYAPIVAPGALWVAFIFSGTLGLGRGFSAEVDTGTLEGLLLAPVSRGAIYVAKVLGSALLMLAVEAVSIPIFIAFFNLPVAQAGLLPVFLLGTIGFAAVATLFAALAANTRAREVLLPVLLFPVVTPVVIASVKATTGVLDGTGLGPWLSLLIAYDALFGAVAFLVFEYVVED